MICVICRTGKTAPGKTTVTLERADTIFVFRGVPADVCGNCGEAYVHEEIAAKLLEEAKEVAKAGVQVHIREFAAAA